MNGSRSSPGDAYFPDYVFHPRANLSGLLEPDINRSYRHTTEYSPFLLHTKLSRVAPVWVFASNLLAPLLTARKAYSILTPAAQTITARDNLSCSTAISHVPATMDHTPALITNNFGPKVKRILLEKL